MSEQGGKGLPRCFRRDCIAEANVNADRDRYMREVCNDGDSDAAIVLILADLLRRDTARIESEAVAARD